jgi:archaemetzincin
LDNFHREDVQILANRISATFNRNVIILKPVTIPTTYLHPVINMYSADSIVQYLSNRIHDTIAEIIGLTHRPLYTIKDAQPMPYYDEGILGFAYQPGNACVVSDNNSKVNRTLPVERLGNNILHEVGHNLGLAHCSNVKCAMVKRYTGNYYCTKCRKKIFN